MNSGSYCELFNQEEKDLILEAVAMKLAFHRGQADRLQARNPHRFSQAAHDHNELHARMERLESKLLEESI